MVRYAIGMFVVMSVLIGFGFIGTAHYTDAMTKCQEKYSYDSCFQMLNR